jgi:glycosyltransferase involved in cell wall biosynthesis
MYPVFVMNNKFSKVSVIFAKVARYSVIVPSYNQERFISETLNNLSELKKRAAEKNIVVEIIVIDNCSNAPTFSIIQTYKENIDKLVVEKDKGQYDAINKGIKLAKGDYWTWLNTDDLIDIEGFFKLHAELLKHPETEYIYGDVSYIDEHSKFHKLASTGELTFNKLLNANASISQPGSFFKTNFTQKIGELAPFHFAFDYEYILRCLKNKAIVRKVEANVAFFRYYTTSKSGSQDFRFLKEQLAINHEYGGAFFSKLSLMLRIRILKRKLFN